MMNEIRLAQASKLTSPNPISLICTERPDGGTNLAAVSWWTYLSYKPEMIGYAMSQKSYSGEQVRATGKVVLAVPGEALAQETMKCGSTTGRSIDKAAEFGIDLMKLDHTDIRVPVHSRLAIVCRLKEYHGVGDHNFYICEVENVYANESENALFAWNGYAELRPVNP